MPRCERDLAGAVEGGRRGARAVEHFEVGVEGGEVQRNVVAQLG